MSICPKNKTSKSRRDKRRANWKMSAPTLVKCSKCGALMVLITNARSSRLRIEHSKEIQNDREAPGKRGLPFVMRQGVVDFYGRV